MDPSHQLGQGVRDVLHVIFPFFLLKTPSHPSLRFFASRTFFTWPRILPAEFTRRARVAWSRRGLVALGCDWIPFTKNHLNLHISKGSGVHMLYNLRSEVLNFPRSQDKHSELCVLSMYLPGLHASQADCQGVPWEPLNKSTKIMKKDK